MVVYRFYCQLSNYVIFWLCATSNGRRLALYHRRAFLLPPTRGGGVMQITYSELFQFCLVVIGIIGLVIQANKKK